MIPTFASTDDARLVAGFLKMNASAFAQHIVTQSCLELREACDVAVEVTDQVALASADDTVRSVIVIEQSEDEQMTLSASFCPTIPKDFQAAPYALQFGATAFQAVLDLHSGDTEAARYRKAIAAFVGTDDRDELLAMREVTEAALPEQEARPMLDCIDILLGEPTAQPADDDTQHRDDDSEPAGFDGLLALDAARDSIGSLVFVACDHSGKIKHNQRSADPDVVVFVKGLLRIYPSTDVLVVDRGTQWLTLKPLYDQEGIELLSLPTGATPAQADAEQLLHSVGLSPGEADFYGPHDDGHNF